MEELKPILINPIVKKYYDKLKTNEQRLEFWENLVFRGMDGQEPQIEDEMVELALMPCLDSIKECRDNYNRRQAKNAEYGILGKEYGKLGGRPRKGETKEEYNERKRLENESLVSEEKGEDSKWTKMFNEIKENKDLIAQINSQTVPDEIFYDFVERYGQKTVLSVFRWIMEKYNKN